VQEESYRHILDDMLYTHAGDDRSLGGPEHDLARDNIVMLFESFGLTVTLHPFMYRSDTYYNVVGAKVGTVYPDQEYIVGAHYDSFSYSLPAPGADDNASGVALVLEAARVLSQYDSEYTIRFIAFDREEQGLVGSYAYVEDHLSDDILGMINADMIAFNPGVDTVDVWGDHPSEPLKLALVQAATGYADLWDPHGLVWNTQAQLPFSDHQPFEDAGFEAVTVEEYAVFQNPYFHTSEDNVDTPNYIDYSYATRITRGVVGFLVDQAGVSVDIPNADYDGDVDVDMDDYSELVSCLTGPGVPPENPDCNFFDLDSDGDIDCPDLDLLAAVWTEPGTPPPFGACTPVPPVAVVEGGRYLTVTPPAPVVPIALLVSGDPNDAVVSCFSAYVQNDGSLSTTPVFQTTEEWGTTSVIDERVVPGTAYHLQCDYGEPGAPVLSRPRVVTTEAWGDTVGEFTGSGWTPPDGTIGIMDIVAIVDKFRDLPTAPPIYWVDLIGLGSSGVECAPDQRIDIIDAVGAVDAFGGKTYWESMGCPQPCPE
jgi:hypothetical protein